MASYSEEYKLECVGKLELLKEKGTINLDGVQIKNVRELVKFLGISSYSIYKWYKEIQYLGRNMDLEIVKKDIEAMTLGELEVSLEKDFPIGDVKLEEQNGIDLLTKQMEDIGYWQSLARAMGLKNYRQKTSQLKLRIGTALINGTGLVESQNKVRKELRLD